MKVVILLTERLSLFELACAVELFALPREEVDHWYRTQVVSLSAQTYSGLCDTQFSCTLVNELPQSDLLVIPSYPVSNATLDRKIAEQVLAHYHRGGRIISFCSGSFLLAELGILNGRIATTHWRYAQEFQQRFPDISYKSDVLYEYDGIIGCSAGSAAGIDLGIEVIRHDFGYNIANSVARRLVLPAHRSGGQSQYVEKPIALTQSSLSKTLDWAVKHLSATLTIEDMATNANMTRRTFDRHFKKHYQITPLAWLLERKLEIAKSLLETTSLPIDDISMRSGFDSAVTLRHNFRKYLSITPSDYRVTFHMSGDGST